MTTIQIDLSKCQNAVDCRKCLNVCQNGVLIASPLGNHYELETQWKITPSLMSLCNGCRRCEKNCPSKAITVF